MRPAVWEVTDKEKGINIVRRHKEQYTRWNSAVTVIKQRRYDGSDMQHVCGQQENVQEIRNGKSSTNDKF
jgi:hypothetical protein